MNSLGAKHTGSQQRSLLRRLYRPLIISGLLTAGLFHIVPKVIAATAAGTSISNTATATYTDPNVPGTTLNSTSNTVTVTVAEVAGISVTPAGTIDNTTNNPAVLPGDELLFDFTIANIGNDSTTFYLPNTATISANATLSRVEIVGYTPAGGSFTSLASAIAIPSGGAVTGNSDTTNTTSGLPGGFGSLPTALPQIGGEATGVIPAGASLTVRVVVIVNASASSGSPVTVTYGETTPTDSDNISLTPGTASTANDVRTVDATNATDDTTGFPSPEREASGQQSMIVGATPIALARLTKVNGNYNSTNNTLDYTLNLTVDATLPTGVPTDLAPADLAPTTNIQVSSAADLSGATAQTVVLVADRLPANTTLSGTPTAPTGWTVVYSTDATATANEAVTWTTVLPAAPVTRVGFINTLTLGNAGTLITRGTTVGPFVFTVDVSAITANTSIYNLAQVFGQTSGTTNPAVDESGDTSPSNLLQDGTANTEPRDPDGTADAGTNGVDNGGNNTGTGAGGEANVFQVPGAVSILNGPNNNPAASGPTSNNDDFTNQSTPVPLNQTTAFDPASITFNNSLSNPTGTALTNVLLVPDVYSYSAIAATNSATTGLPVAGTSLPPTGTTVTLTVGATSATYTFNGTNFIYSSGTAILIPSVAPGEEIDYTVSVNLPTGTALSTTTGTGYDIPIWAFQDTNYPTGDGRPSATETVLNRTIDRVYTGYLRLFKQARIFDTNGTTLLSNENTITSDLTDGWFVNDTTTFPNQVAAIQALVQPDRFIQYRITYENISTAVSGVNSVALNASSVVITENGTTGGNNWATELNSLILTSHVNGTASASLGTITYNNGGERSGDTQATDVVEYINNVNTVVQPLGTGTFTFRRQFN